MIIATLMARSKELISKEKAQYSVLLALSTGVLGLTGIVSFSGEHPFQRFIGGINPLLAGFLIIILGMVLLSFLLARGWFAIYKKENSKGLIRSCGLAALLGFIMILVDRRVVFPADMNIMFPGSLLFYPAMAFFVEILFHILPLSILLVFLTSISKEMTYKNTIGVCIFLVALLEPAYQMVLMGFTGHAPSWIAVYVCFHVFLINFFQLLIFKRYDFISMYSFRLVYYMIWHVAWGSIRLMR